MVTFNKADARRLKAVSERGDVPVTVLIRRAVLAQIPKWEADLDENRLALLTTGGKL